MKLTYADVLWSPQGDNRSKMAQPLANKKPAIYSTHAHDIFSAKQAYVPAMVYAIAYATAHLGHRFIFSVCDVKRAAEWFSDERLREKISFCARYQLRAGVGIDDPMKEFPPRNVALAAYVSRPEHESRISAVADLPAACRAVIVECERFVSFEHLVWRELYAPVLNESRLPATAKQLVSPPRAAASTTTRKIDWLIACNCRFAVTENLLLQCEQTGTPIYVDGIPGRSNDPKYWPEMFRVQQYPPQLDRKSRLPDDFPKANYRKPKSFSVMELDDAKAMDLSDGSLVELTDEEMEVDNG